MIPIAAVLLLMVIALSVAIVLSPTAFDLSVLGATVPVTTSGFYFTGAVAMLVMILAVALMQRGLRRERGRRRQVKALQAAAGVKGAPSTSSRPGRLKSKLRESSVVLKDASGPAPSGSHVHQASTQQVEPREVGTRAEDQPQRATDLSTDEERRALLEEAEELNGGGSER